MDGYAIHVVAHMRQRVGNRVLALFATQHDRNTEDRGVGGEPRIKRLAIFGADHQNQLLDIVTIDELLGRVIPHSSIGQRCEGLFVVFVAEPAALSRGGQDDAKGCHAVPPRQAQTMKQDAPLSGFAPVRQAALSLWSMRSSAVKAISQRGRVSR